MGREVRDVDRDMGDLMRVCAVDSCVEPYSCKGYCVKHYNAFRRHGDPLAGKPPRDPDAKCSIDGCDRAISSRGYCKKHYSRWQRHDGDVSDPPPVKRRALLCSVPGCDRAYASKGLCGLHYQRIQRTGSLEPKLPKKATDICSVESCGDPFYCKGYCKLHYSRYRRNGDPLVLRPDKRSGCMVDGCDAPHHGGGYCSNHLAKFTKYGDPLASGGPITGRPPRGGVPGYDAAHKRVHRLKGPAKNFRCTECDWPADEWSYNGGDPDELVTDPALRNEAPGIKYSLKPEFYVPRCTWCHRHIDGSVQALAESRKVSGL